MKKKIINIISIICIIFAGCILHELIYALVKYLIPYPITLGLIGGFALGFIYNKKP